MPCPNEHPPPKVIPILFTVERAVRKLCSVDVSRLAIIPYTPDQWSEVIGTVKVTVPPAKTYETGLLHQRPSLITSPVPQKNGLTVDGLGQVLLASLI